MWDSSFIHTPQPLPLFFPLHPYYRPLAPSRIAAASAPPTVISVDPTTVIEHTAFGLHLVCTNVDQDARITVSGELCTDVCSPSTPPALPSAVLPLYREVPSTPSKQKGWQAGLVVCSGMITRILSLLTSKLSSVWKYSTPARGYPLPPFLFLHGWPESTRGTARHSICRSLTKSVCCRHPSHPVAVPRTPTWSCQITIALGGLTCTVPGTLSPGKASVVATTAVGLQAELIDAITVVGLCWLAEGRSIASSAPAVEAAPALIHGRACGHTRIRETARALALGGQHGMGSALVVRFAQACVSVSPSLLCWLLALDFCLASCDSDLSILPLKLPDADATSPSCPDRYRRVARPRRRRRRCVAHPDRIGLHRWHRRHDRRHHRRRCRRVHGELAHMYGARGQVVARAAASRRDRDLGRHHDHQG